MRRCARRVGTAEMLKPPRSRNGHRQRVAVVMAVAVSALVGGLGCSSATAPNPPPTLLVTNATCEAGPCKTLYLRVFILGWPIPQPLTGIKLLGFVHGTNTCLRFPAEWTLWVVSGRDSTQLTWKPDSPEGIFLLAFDSAIGYGHPTPAEIDSSNHGLWPYDGAFLGSVGHSTTFVPATSPGWSTAFPPETQSGAATPGLTKAVACTP